MNKKGFKIIKLKYSLALCALFSSLAFSQSLPPRLTDQSVDNKPSSSLKSQLYGQSLGPLSSESMDSLAVAKQSLEMGLMYLDWRALVKEQTGRWMDLEETRNHLRMGRGFETPGVVNWRFGENGSVLASTQDAKICLDFQRQIAALPLSNPLYPVEDLPQAGCIPDGVAYTLYFLQPALLIKKYELAD